MDMSSDRFCNLPQSSCHKIENSVFLILFARSNQRKPNALAVCPSEIITQRYNSAKFTVESGGKLALKQSSLIYNRIMIAPK